MAPPSRRGLIHWYRPRLGAVRSMVLLVWECEFVCEDTRVCMYVLACDHERGGEEDGKRILQGLYQILRVFTLQESDSWRVGSKDLDSPPSSSSKEIPPCGWVPVANGNALSHSREKGWKSTR